MSATGSPNGARDEAAERQAVLLTNGRVLQGRVTHNGNLISIEMDDTARLSIDKKQVEHIADSLQDLYFYKLSAIRDSHPGDHFQLARWCLVNDLLDEAVHHYQRVASVAGKHPRVRQLGEEIKQKLLEQPGFRQFLGLPPRHRPQVAAYDKDRSVIVSASANGSIPLESGSQDSSVQLAVARPQNHETAGQEVRLLFQHAIEPLLVNRCAQQGCHGTGSKRPWTLSVPAGDYAAISSQTVDQNLRATLPLVADGDGRSPLLEHATTAHGGLKHPPIARAEKELIDQLRTWIGLVNHPAISTATAVSGRQDTEERAPEAGQRSLQRTTRQLPVVPRDPTQHAAGKRPPLVSEAELDALERAIEQAVKQSRSATQDAHVPADPFDPAVFNRGSQ